MVKCLPKSFDKINWFWWFIFSFRNSGFRSYNLKQKLWNLSRIYISAIVGFLEDLKVNMICSSVVTCPCPDEPQSLEGLETLAQATYHLPAVIGTGFLNMIGYFCLAPHSYVIFSDSQRRSPSPSCSPPSVPISNSFILPTYSPLPPKSPNPSISISVSTENLTASMLCPL